MHTRAPIGSQDLPGSFVKRLADEYLRYFGKEVVEDFAVLTSRLWDPTMGIVIYFQNEPVFISSCVMDVFGARDRCDMTNVPPLQGTEWDYYAINEATLPKVAVQGDSTVVFLGERKEPYPKLPLRAHEAEAIRIGGTAVQLAAREAMTTSTFQPCYIRQDDGHVLKLAPRLPNLLGYNADDTRWIPQEWFAPIQPGPSGRGTSEVTTADGGKATLEWLRMPIPNFNMFWVRRMPTLI